MEDRQAFRLQQEADNQKANYVLCAFLLVVESLMLVVYYLSQKPGRPALPPVYLRFYLTAILGGLAFPVLEWLSRRWRPAHIAVQFVSLNALLIWGCLLAVCDVRHGNGGGAYAQLLIFTSAMLRLPRPLHYIINVYTWLAFVLLVYCSGVPAQAIYSEAINSAIFLLNAVVVIHITDSFQYAAFRSARRQIRMQREQLDMMAEQVRRVQGLMEQLRIMRHDLRHYGVAVQQALDRADYGQAAAIARQLAGDPAQTAETPIRTYTGIPDVDAALSRCAAWAAERGVAFRATLPPLSTALPAQDLAMVLMNALENARTAVERQPLASERYIRVAGDSYRGGCFLELANSCIPGSVTIQKKTGLPVARQAGHGYGTKSMVSILQRYGVRHRFQVQDGEFRFQCLLPATPEPDGGDD